MTRIPALVLVGTLVASIPWLRSVETELERQREGDGPVSAVRRLVDADNAADLEAVLDSYTVDAVLIPPGRQHISGNQAIREHYSGLLAANRLEIQLEITEAESSGTLGFVVGRTIGAAITLADGDRTAIYDDFIALVRRDSDGAWRIHHLLWNAAER